MGTIDRFSYSSAPIKRVKAVQFCVWDPEEIVSGAAPACGLNGCCWRSAGQGHTPYSLLS